LDPRKNAATLWKEAAHSVCSEQEPQAEERREIDWPPLWGRWDTWKIIMPEVHQAGSKEDPFWGKTRVNRKKERILEYFVAGKGGRLFSKKKAAKKKPRVKERG